MKLLIQSKYKNNLVKFHQFNKKINESNFLMYFIIDDLIGKSYQNFRNYYELITKNETHKLKFGTLYEIADEALDTDDPVKERYWEDKIFQNLTNDSVKSEEFYIVTVGNNGSYTNFHPITFSEVQGLRSIMLYYLSDNQYRDEIHITGQAKMLLYVNDGNALKDIARKAHIDYHTVHEIKWHKKDIKDLPRKTITFLNNYYLQSDFCREINK